MDPSPHHATAIQKRPSWLTALIVLSVLSVPTDLWTSLQRAQEFPAQFVLALLQSTLMLASAVGLWRMRKWGLVSLAATVLVWLLIRTPLFLAQTPVYLPQTSFWYATACTSALYAIVFVALARLRRSGRLS